MIWEKSQEHSRTSLFQSQSDRVKNKLITLNAAADNGGLGTTTNNLMRRHIAAENGGRDRGLGITTNDLIRRHITAASAVPEAKLLLVVRMMAIIGVSRRMVVHPASLRAMRMKSGNNPDASVKNIDELPHGDVEGIEISATIAIGIETEKRISLCER